MTWGKDALSGYCGYYQLSSCDVVLQTDPFQGDGDKGLHEQRIQKRTGQLFFPL